MQRLALLALALCLAPALVAGACDQCAVGLTVTPTPSGYSVIMRVVAPNCQTGCPITFTAPVDSCIVKTCTGGSGTGSTINGVFTYTFTYTAGGVDITATDAWAPTEQIQLVSQPNSFTDQGGHTTTFQYPRPKCACVNGCMTIGKFYDSNANGVKDSGEAELQGWVFKVTSLYTGAFAFYNTTKTISDLPVGNYEVCDLPPTTFNWWPTTGMNCRTVSVVKGACTSVEFGCVCTGTGNGLNSVYFFNNTVQLTPADFAAVNALTLYSAPSNAPAPDINTRGQLGSWFLAATGVGATPLSKLSAQRALLELKMRYGQTANLIKTYMDVMVDMGSTVPVGSFSSVLAFADNLLATESANNAVVNHFATLLGNLNANEGFVQSTPCPYAFSTSLTPSATPLVRPCGCPFPPAYNGGNCGNCLNGLTATPTVSGYSALLSVHAPNCPTGCSLTLNFSTPFCATKAAVGLCGTIISQRPTFAYKFYPTAGAGVINITDTFTPGSSVSIQMRPASFVDQAGNVKTFQTFMPVCSAGSPPAPAIVDSPAADSKETDGAFFGATVGGNTLAIVAAAVGCAALVALAVGLFIRRRMNQRLVAPKADAVTPAELP